MTSFPDLEARSHGIVQTVAILVIWIVGASAILAAMALAVTLKISDVLIPDHHFKGIDQSKSALAESLVKTFDPDCFRLADQITFTEFTSERAAWECRIGGRSRKATTAVCSGGYWKGPKYVWRGWPDGWMPDPGTMNGPRCRTDFTESLPAGIRGLFAAS